MAASRRAGSLAVNNVDCQESPLLVWIETLHAGADADLRRDRTLAYSDRCERRVARLRCEINLVAQPSGASTPVLERQVTPQHAAEVREMGNALLRPGDAEVQL